MCMYAFYSRQNLMIYVMVSHFACITPVLILLFKILSSLSLFFTTIHLLAQDCPSTLFPPLPLFPGLFHGLLSCALSSVQVCMILSWFIINASVSLSELAKFCLLLMLICYIWESAIFFFVKFHFQGSWYLFLPFRMLMLLQFLFGKLKQVTGLVIWR